MNIDLPHSASWERRTGGTPRGDATYAEPVDIPCRVERRSAFERGEGDQSYTRIMVGPATLVGVSDKLDYGNGPEVIEDYSDGVDMAGGLVHRIVYTEGGRL